MKLCDKLKKLNELAETFALAKGDEVQLTHFRKSQLAILKKRILEEHPKWSNAKCDDEARSKSEYIQVLDGLKEATIKKELALWQLKNEHASIGIYQTMQADKRADINYLKHNT